MYYLIVVMKSAEEVVVGKVIRRKRPCVGPAQLSRVQGGYKSRDPAACGQNAEKVIAMSPLSVVGAS